MSGTSSTCHCVSLEPGINSLRRAFGQPAFYYPLYVAAFLFVLVLCFSIAKYGHSLGELEVRDYTVRRCEYSQVADEPVLRILDAVNLEHIDSLTSWCHSSGLADDYAALELRSIHRDQMDLRELYESRYDLVLAKPEMVGDSSGSPAEGINYEMIAQYPAYGSQLVSLQGTPELSSTWMQGKRLGLLDDPNSVSAYQVPRAALQRAGLLSVPEIVHFRTYRELLRALLEGRVDLIASIRSAEGPDSALQLPPGLVLTEGIPGAAWYLNRDLKGSPVSCALIGVLEQMATDAPVDYLSKLRVLAPCVGES